MYTLPPSFLMYSDGTNNLAAIQQNNIGLWIASDASSTAYHTMKFSYRSKRRYRDWETIH